LNIVWFGLQRLDEDEDDVVITFFKMMKRIRLRRKIDEKEIL